MTHEELIDRTHAELVEMVENLQKQLNEQIGLTEQYNRWWIEDRQKFNELNAKMDAISAMNKLGLIMINI